MKSPMTVNRIEDARLVAEWVKMDGRGMSLEDSVWAF